VEAALAKKPGGVGLYKSLADLLQEQRLSRDQVATQADVVGCLEIFGENAACCAMRSGFYSNLQRHVK
jgi:hypothetical protein